MGGSSCPSGIGTGSSPPAAPWPLQIQGEPQLKHYWLWIEAIAPDRRRRDLDNLLKPTSDLLKRAGVIEDDAFARAIIIHWSRQPPAKPGSLQLRIYNART